MGKTCIACGLEKETSEFYRHKQMADGFLGRCKLCQRQNSKAAKDRDPVYYKEYDRARAMTPVRIALRKAYRQTDRGKAVVAAISRAWTIKNPEKKRAQYLCGVALRNGVISRQPCVTCGHSFGHAHHNDYSRPLDVVFLCASCHSKHHRNLQGPQ